VTTLFVRATRLVNGTPRFLDPQESKTPEPINIKLDRGDYVGDLTPHANFDISTLTGGTALHMRENVIIRVYFYAAPSLVTFYFLAHLHRSHRLTEIYMVNAQKTYFRVIFVLFGVRTNYYFLYIFHYFSPKT